MAPGTWKKRRGGFEVARRGDTREDAGRRAKTATPAAAEFTQGTGCPDVAIDRPVFRANGCAQTRGRVRRCALMESGFRVAPLGRIPRGGQSALGEGWPQCPVTRIFPARFDCCYRAMRKGERKKGRRAIARRPAFEREALFSDPGSAASGGRGRSTRCRGEQASTRRRERCCCPFPRS